ncbi:helix-turn-helix transcriptional regulator [Microbacterium sp. YMB-B2]|uniref:Helix-turn-helix transcriptional regulator n=1 Tax=Microbacterium tenebrionis TaxID=2830665 RepID=A0A9X1LNR8_9MICO|nr:helix-turn-helix transcriptional regulator [Microbacterium tenebrionis]
MLFEQQGVDGTTVEDIARAAGVSPRTCFRYFPSKESMVLRLHDHVDEAIENWLDHIRPDQSLFHQLEEVFAEVVAQLGDTDSPVGQRFLRVRTLVQTDNTLRFAARAIDVENAERIADRISERFSTRGELLEARLATECARVMLWTSFDQWAWMVENGEDASLSDVYADTRRHMRAVIS